ncbi:MAG: patatin family protein [Coriobacteriia bacterium]|nr:patatin family protein [Coriobacteriia bacterium]
MRYLPYTSPGYQPAWQSATIAEANLILEGGSFRSLFTAGILDYLMDEKLLPRHAIGVSAGALVGVNYVAGSRGRSCFINTKYCDNWHYFSKRSLILTGNAFSPRYSFNKIPNKLDPFDFESYHASPLDLVITTCNIETGEIVYTPVNDPIIDAAYLQASISLPLIARTVHVDGVHLLDGGMCNSVPIEYAKKTGVEKQIVILTQDASYVKGPDKSLWLMRLRYKRYPHFIDRLENRHLKYNDKYRLITSMQETGEVFMIRPPMPVRVANMEHNPQMLTELYEIGYEEGRKNFCALQRFLEL